MLEKRVKIQSVVENQLPDFIRSESQRTGDFLQTYYKSVESQGGPIDLLENIDQYVKVGTYTSIVGFTSITSNVDSVDDTIDVTSTNGWPDSYGLLKIDNEIISYTGKTSTSFTGCIRGFSGITSYRGTSGPDELIFESSLADEHTSGSRVINLSSLFLREFLKKLKAQFLPGFENRELYSGVNIANFIRQSKDFYTSKGTENSFEILFKALYGEDVKVLKPQDNLFIPSDAGYRRTIQLVVEASEGDVRNLESKTVYQSDEDGTIVASGSVVDIEEIKRDDRIFYKINIDFDYNKDSGVFGSISGSFRIDPHTKVIGNVSSGSTVITVDSTLGFSTSGSLLVNFGNETTGIVSYTSKSINQFYNCSGILEIIPDKTEIQQNVLSYGFDDAGNQITFKVKGSLGQYQIDEISQEIPYFENGDVVKLQSLGVDDSNLIADSFLYNITSKLKVKNIEISGNNYIIQTYDIHDFRVGDSVEIVDDREMTFGGGVISISSDYEFTCNGFNGIDVNRSFNIAKKISNVSSQNSLLNLFLSDVTSSYFDTEQNIYVASNSLPRYTNPLNVKDGSVTISGSFSSETITANDHGFITGEEVYYVPDTYVEIVSGYGNPVAITTTSSLDGLVEGNYFIKKIDDDNFKLANSRSDILQDNYITVSGIASAQKIYPLDSYENTLDATKQIVKIPAFPTSSAIDHTTHPGITGIFVNGVNILNYKSEDYLYYGGIVDFNVTSSGSDYDVINPPKVLIEDSVGSGATATATVSGSLQKIDVIDPGSDFVTTPLITISGGNGNGAEAKASLKYQKVVNFTDTSAGAGYISTTANIIGFSTYHKFRNGDAVVYDRNNQTAIGIGSTSTSLVRDADLASNSTYYVSVVGLSSVTLHNTKPDAVAGINTINITDFGSGNHYFTTVDLKAFLSSISVVTPGSGYRNNEVKVLPSGISTASNTVSYINHGFADGDLVTYQFEGTAISGLTTDQNYYVLKETDNQFGLAAAGIGTTISTTNYDNRVFVDLKSVGLGTHIFNHPQISVSISGVIGIATTNANIFQPVVQPLFRGGIEKINLVQSGTGYGSSDVINFERQPLVTFESGKSAQAKAIISNGTIKEVLVINGGSGYDSAPTLKVSGSGTKASLTPVITNGVITSIKINDGGVGYSTNTTFVDVIPAGKGASVRTKIKSWNINNFERYKNRLSNDDGVLYKSLNDYSKGTFASISAPRELRRNLYAKNNDGSKRYGTFDLTLVNGLETKSTNHSPIIGWAFDGNPIYGPYGYGTSTGGAVREMKSGYELLPNSNRPSNYPLGFFVEDYVYTNSGDLDERNGRFCKTPDYPQGTYAYFATISDGSVESSGSFQNYKLPVFPYVIGKSYKSEPIDFISDRKNNQVDYDFSGLLRNTKPTKVNALYGSNDYINSTIDDPNQVAKVTSIKDGSVYDFGIVSSGSSYKNGEYVVFDQPSPSFGQRTIAKINRVKGKKIVSFASSTISSANVEFFAASGSVIGYCTEPHNFENRDRVVISGLSTSVFEGISGQRTINNSLRYQRTWYLEDYLADPSITGLTTTISLIGPYDPLFVRENNIIGIGSSAQDLEQLKVLNVDPLNRRMRVQRQYNGTIGYAYSSRTLAIELPSSISFSVGFSTYTSNPPTFQRYFNPSEVVGLGTTATVGIGTTITYEILNNIAPPHKQENAFYEIGIGYTSKIVPINSILIQNHSFEMGDELIYSNGGGSSIQVSNGASTFTLDDQSVVYAIKESNDLLGISTTKVGLGSTGQYVGLGSTAIRLSFTSVGSGVTHSFKLNSNPLTGEVDIYEATLTTDEPHGLLFSDRIDISVRPGYTTSVFVQYNDYNRRIVFDRRGFTTSEVNTTTNTITIQDHNLSSGDKVIFTTNGTSPSGLTNNGIYYAIFIDNNNFKLSASLLNSNGSHPVPVRISSTGTGEHFVSKVNPKVNAVIGTKVSFALTDTSLSFVSGGSSLSAFDMRFYTDSNFIDRFVSSKASTNFEVTSTGTIGVSNDAKVDLLVSEFLPSKLYYKFVPVNTDLSPVEKVEVIEDSEVISSNRINVERSSYTAVQYPTGIGSTTFRYLISAQPEKSSYSESDGSFSYTTNSQNAKGPIESIEVVQNGFGYKSLPGITSIRTESGSGAVIVPVGDMGRINKVDLQDVGYDYPSDPTLKVFANPPEVLVLEELNSFGEIGITSGGKNYLTPPQFIVKDGSTNKLMSEVKLSASIKNGSITKVNVLENTKSLSDSKPKIITINNSNGVGIRTVGFNSVTKEVSVQFDVGFSTSGSFPFSIGDLVYVENIGIGSTGSGYNSSDYDYKLFELTYVDENIGGIGSVTYKLDSTVTNPGTYSTSRSYGRVIPSTDLPVFDPQLVKNNFSVGEIVYSGDIQGTVSSWNSNAKILKVNSKKEFEVGSEIIGKSSLSKAKISDKYNATSYFDIESSPLVIKGWTKDTGKLSDSTQRIIDSDYYQYFSYSLKSKIAYETWNEVVSSLNHTSGFKKFSDLIIESESEDTSLPVIDASDVETTVDLISEVSTYCTFDFDYVTEKTITLSGSTLGNEIVLKNRAITDYEESVGNRVLRIDDFSSQFSSDPRSTAFSVVDTFPLSEARFRKYFLSVNDTQFVDNVQSSIIELLIDDNGTGYIQEYGDVDTNLNAYYDFQVSGTEGRLLFYPERFQSNNYDIHGLVYNINRDTHTSVGIATLVGVTTIADIVTIEARGTTINAGVTTSVNILSFSASDYNSGKLLVQANKNGKHEVVNLNILHDNSDIIGVEYGRINDDDTSTLPGPGLGTYGATLSGGIVYLSFTPSTAGAGITFNISSTKFHSGVSTLGIGTSTLVNGKIVAGFTSIAASGSPGITTIASFTDPEDAIYVYAEIEDLTNNDLQFSEIIAVGNESDSAMTEYGILQTNTGLGTFGLEYVGSGQVDLRFTPIPSVITNVRTLYHSNKHVSSGLDQIDLGDTKIQNVEGSYSGTEVDVRRAFGLFHETFPIFTRSFDASSSSVVDVDNDLIVIPNHFFVSGERISYTSIGSGTTSNIGIATTTISGVSTDKLPFDLYAIKIDEKSIRLAGSAEDALVSTSGNYLNLTSVGIGTSHVFQAYDQNSKVIVAIDNNIQDPVVSTGVEYSLVDDLSFGGEQMKISGITSIFGADLLKIEDEIVRVKTVGLGSTNILLVQRAWMGTGLSTHPSGASVTKYDGAYNIVGNTINFYSAPIGPRPGVVSDDPNQQDYTGIQTYSTFQGRVFLRNGQIGQTTNTYHDNYIFNSLSNEFNGIGKTFTLKSDGSNISGFSTDHSLILINEIAQGPSQGSRINDFSLIENAGITSIVFSGFGASVTNDVNTGTVPVGGVIVSVGSTTGFGYQPLVAAGGTATVSGFGTISSISIGNSGSGYRSGIQTYDGTIQEVSYNIGVRTDTNSVVSIGTVLISNGNVVGVSITNPGVGYTFANPPIVVIDAPLSYSDIPLLYQSSSTGQNIGTNARANIVVGQGSSVIDFEIINGGYGYREQEILTIPVGGVAGIPTDSTVGAGFSDFRINIERVFNDKFSGWHFGQLDVLDKLDEEFDGFTQVFGLKKEGVPVTIRSAKGSLVDVQQTLLVFINDILQEPGAGYIFGGGSQITFTEAPKEGDTSKILFYRGTGSVDVVSKDILETIKVGDTVRIENGELAAYYRQDERIVSGIQTADTFNTSPYIGPGLTTDTTLERPLTWCRQVEDLIINGQEIGKDRVLYEPSIYPSTNIIQPVGLASTEIWVQNTNILFNAYKESLESTKQIVYVQSQDEKIAAAATAVVSGFGTISSISITSSGLGYTVAPTVSIGNPVGLGTTYAATATASITGSGVASITVTSAGSGYTFTNPPQVLISSEQFDREEISNVSYEGDFGIISGVATTSVGAAVTGLVFDLVIPNGSELRSSANVGPSGITTISGIQTGYYFVVYNSNVGSGVTSLNSAGSVVGVGTSFIDNVYEAISVSIASSEAVGFGTTYVLKVTVSLDSYNGLSGYGHSEFFGEFSWGKLKDISRPGTSYSFTPYLNNGLLGISTSPSVTRKTPLKSLGYLT